MGNHSGVVKVPNTENMVYVRLPNGQVIKVFNSIAPNIYNWKVYIGRDKSQPGLLKVTEVRWVHNIVETIAYVVFHHKQHEYPAPDTVWVRRDQFLPLLVLPAGGLHVRLYGDVVYAPGMVAPVRVANEEDIDLSSHAVVAGAKYVLMEVDPTGALQYVTGDTVDSIDILRVGTPIPSPSEGNFPICVFEFYEGQTELRRDDEERNIIDLRMFTSNRSTGVATDVHGATEKMTLVDGDEVGIADSEDGFTLKKINLIERLAEWFSDLLHNHDADYAEIGHTHTGSLPLKIVMQPDVIDPPVPVLTPEGDDYVYYEVE
jgi:hypothetical protein